MCWIEIITCTQCGTQTEEEVPCNADGLDSCCPQPSRVDIDAYEGFICPACGNTGSPSAAATAANARAWQTEQSKLFPYGIDFARSAGTASNNPSTTNESPQNQSSHRPCTTQSKPATQAPNPKPPQNKTPYVDDQGAVIWKISDGQGGYRTLRFEACVSDSEDKAEQLKRPLAVQRARAERKRRVDSACEIGTESRFDLDAEEREGDAVVVRVLKRIRGMGGGGG